MAQEIAAAEEDGDFPHEEAEGGQTGRADGRGSKLGKMMKLMTYHPTREVLAIEEIRLKYLRQGIDVSRSRLVSEAIKLLTQATSEGKFELRG